MAPYAIQRGLAKLNVDSLASSFASSSNKRAFSLSASESSSFERLEKALHQWKLQNFSNLQQLLGPLIYCVRVASSGSAFPACSLSYRSRKKGLTRNASAWKPSAHKCTRHPNKSICHCQKRQRFQAQRAS